MLNAHAIFKLLLDDELPPAEVPVDTDPFNGLDPEAELTRLLNAPVQLRGYPVTLYQDFQRKLKGRPSRKMTGERIGRATYLKDLGDRIVLRVYNTDVLSVTPENRVVVNSDGWRSDLTARAIDYGCPGGWRIFKRWTPRRDLQSLDFFWFNRAYHDKPNSKKFVPYTDGDVIEPDGTLVMQSLPSDKRPL